MKDYQQDKQGKNNNNNLKSINNNSQRIRNLFNKRRITQLMF